jgi:hypothetical protein
VRPIGGDLMVGAGCLGHSDRLLAMSSRDSPQRGRELMRRSSVVAVIAMLMAAGAFALGHTSTPRAGSPNLIRLEHGVPVGVLDTRAGALAAADNYLASEDEALLSADGTRRVVDAIWAPADRAVELVQPFPAAGLAGKPATFAGLKLTAAVAADKLESYTPQTAQIAVWHEITIWSPTVAPTQRWTLDTVTLVWDSGRWLVAQRSPAPDSKTPVPSWTSGGPPDRTSRAFDARLAGMSAPYYEGSQP